MKVVSAAVSQHEGPHFKYVNPESGPFSMDFACKHNKETDKSKTAAKVCNASPKRYIRQIR